MPSKQDVSSAYTQLLGRPMQDPEYGYWAGNNNYWSEIGASPEANAYLKTQQPASDPQSYWTSQPPGSTTPWLPAGDLSVPPTAYATEPSDIAPNLFGDVNEPGPTPPPMPRSSASAPSFPAPGRGWSAGSSQPLPGFDLTKWQDPNFHDAKYDYGHAASALGGAGETQIPLIMNYLRDMGYNVEWSGGDHAVVDGIPIDLSEDYGPGGKNQPHWEGIPGATGTGATGTDSGTSPVPTPTSRKTSGSGGSTGTGSGSFGDFMSSFGSLLPPQPSRPSFPSGFGGPGAGITEGLNQAGQDPLSELMSSGLAGLLQEGGTPYGQNIAVTLADLIGRGGVTPATEINLNRARDSEATAFKGMMADARSELASRGTASMPGVEQGPENLAIRRTSEALAPAYADAVAGIESHAIDVSNASTMQALQMATGLSQDQANNVLAAVGTGTARQQVLSNIALDVLRENIGWNEFLADYGLRHDQVQEQMQQGRIDSLLPLLEMYFKLAQQSAQGFIGAN